MMPERAQLDDLWRARVRIARANYETAVAVFKQTWAEHYDEHLTADPSYAIRQARRVEGAALAEYMRVLRIFSDLVLHGRQPPDEMDGAAA